MPAEAKTLVSRRALACESHTYWPEPKRSVSPQFLLFTQVPKIQAQRSGLHDGVTGDGRTLCQPAEYPRLYLQLD
jgi:hypothetical protein